jgi:hypothetical protein
MYKLQYPINHINFLDMCQSFWKGYVKFKWISKIYSSSSAREASAGTLSRLALGGWPFLPRAGEWWRRSFEIHLFFYCFSISTRCRILFHPMPHPLSHNLLFSFTSIQTWIERQGFTAPDQTKLKKIQSTTNLLPVENDQTKNFLIDLLHQTRYLKSSTFFSIYFRFKHIMRSG